MASFGKYVHVTSIVGGDDDGLPLCDGDIIANCEREAYEAEQSSENDDDRKASLMRLSWALVNSKRPDDVNRGMAMLADASENEPACPKEAREERERLYLLSLGYYRTGWYEQSRKYLEQCIELEPDWERAITLKKLLTKRTKKDGVMGMIIATGTIGVLGFAVAGVMGAVGAVAVATGGVVAMARRT